MDTYNDRVEKTPKHYYGDIVRRLIFSAGILVMLLAIFDEDLLSFYLLFGVVAVLVIVFLAGFTSPRQKWAILVDLLVSSVGFLMFEYFAISRYLSVDTIFDTVFFLRQLTAFVFITAVYFSAKTIRSIF